MENSTDSSDVEKGVSKFIDWLISGKMMIRAYPTANIHAKLYIMTFVEEDKDKGRVITGSSNFTQAGLVDNLEFNVELKDR
jgi:HKD family nuclease